jgi:acyl-CoA synthetase (AMP-forming)/AMP-acid ligase II
MRTELHRFHCKAKPSEQRWIASRLSVLVMARSFRKTDYLEMLLALAPELADARGAALVLEKLSYLRHLIKVMDVQVIGVPDTKYGEEICAWVRLREGQDATEQEIRDFCRGRIASYKIPRYVRLSTEFPTTVTGKVQKYRMREISVAELGLTTAGAVRTA